jgi:hypothetical protein
LVNLLEEIFKDYPKYKLDNQIIDPTYVKPKLEIFYNKWSAKIDLELVENERYSSSFVFYKKNKHPYLFPWFLIYAPSSPLILLKEFKQFIEKIEYVNLTWSDFQDLIYTWYNKEAFSSSPLAWTSQIAEYLHYILKVYNQIPENISWGRARDGILDTDFFNRHKSLYYKFTHNQLKILDQNISGRFLGLISLFIPRNWKLYGVFIFNNEILNHLPENHFSFWDVREKSLNVKIFETFWITDIFNRRHQLYLYQIRNIHHWWNLNHLTQLRDKNYFFGFIPFQEAFDLFSLDELGKPEWFIILPVHPNSTDNILTTEAHNKLNRKVIDTFNHRIKQKSTKIPLYNDNSFKDIKHPYWELFRLNSILRNIPKHQQIIIKLWGTTRNARIFIQNKLIPFFKYWLPRGPLFELYGGLVCSTYLPTKISPDDFIDLYQLCDKYKISIQILFPSDTQINQIDYYNLPPSHMFNEEKKEWNFL